MNAESHNATERPVAAAPAKEQFGPGLGRQDARPANSRRDVMNTLLGKNNLSASDLSGDDPYNNTGKFFRR
jgi:hypothetical protein